MAYANLKQLFRFGIVGISAATTHFFITVWLVSYFDLHPLIANIFAFLVAFLISYTGHNYWTFQGHSTMAKTSLSRFLIIAISSFILNESLLYLFIIPIQLNYIPALLIVLTIVPPITYIWSRLWAFR